MGNRPVGIGSAWCWNVQRCKLGNSISDMCNVPAMKATFLRSHRYQQLISNLPCMRKVCQGADPCACKNRRAQLRIFHKLGILNS